MIRTNNGRLVATTGRRLLIGVLLVLAGTATIAFGASKKSPSVVAATSAKNDAAWRTQAYSKTSEFAQRLMLLEFSEKNNPACEPTTKVTNEMRRKNYPIQRVERASGGDVLFKQYEVKTVPTLVLLFDGKELGRVVVKKDDPKVTTKRLLTLFQKGRDAVAANPRVRAKEPEFVSKAKPARGLLFPRAIERASQARAQAPDASSNSEPSVEAEVSILETRAEEISNLIGEARLEASTVRVVVKAPDGNSSREGVGTAIHYNSQYRETLAVVAAGLFTGISDPASYPDVVVEIFNAEKNEIDKVGAQCVRCDPDAGVAFVAAQVDSPVKPVAFLPKKSPLEPSERAVSFARRGLDVVKSFHDVLAVDQRRFYENREEQSAYVSYVEASNPPATENLGAGLYALRNGRFYFAGLFVSNGEKGRVVPATVVSQALLVNRNLTTVYRDQIANKFDAPASDAEIDAAIERLLKLDAEKKAKEPNAKGGAYAASDPLGVSVALSEPVSSFDENKRPDVSFNEPVPSRADDALANMTGLSSEQSDVSSFPNNAKDAFARSEAFANSLSENASFQLAESFQQNSGEAKDPVEAALAESETTARGESEREVAQTTNSSATETTAADASAARAQLAFSDRSPLPETKEEQSAPTSAAPSTVANNDATASSSVDAPFPDAQDTLLTAEATPAPTSETAPLVASSNDVAARVDAQLVASGAASPAVKSPYAAEPLPTPNSDLIRSVTFGNREQIEAFNREEEQFESALDSLRRRGMEGAEIICIVNWPDGSGVRETEVVRLPRRSALTNPAAPGAGIELARTPEGNRADGQSGAPLTSSRPDARVYK